jgi:NAD(P)-dependent dehydrogenase (short-subunit alcohol dehydrogenase family)
VTAVTTPGELFSLSGTVALVTGATSGIGLATAALLAGAGARTVLTGIATQDPAGVAERLASTGLPVKGAVLDATDEAAITDLAGAVLATEGRIDTVVCSAGVALDTGPHTVTTDAQLDAMFDLHVRGVLRLANATIPAMAEHGWGAFVVLSSIAGLRGNRLLGGYGVTKAANAQLVRNLAVQWGGAHVRVNAISPGVIATDFALPITEEPGIAAARLAKTPLGRFGTADEVAGAVLWLASPAGAFVTGQNIVIDGGTLISD